MERFVCVHGHFYQPPRENAWLEQIEIQDSAYPYHDWNERIAAECYTPNAESRILDHDAFITRIVNNYSRMSFNFGPTLLSWMEKNVPATYEAILRADRSSMERFSGHGSALAQAYNHMILPLANRRDKVTQVRWGIADFEHRFSHKPEGMWLPETAVDIETLDVLAEHDIRFTILAPRQAARARSAGSSEWQDVSGERIDPTVAYSQALPSGRSIAIFFYDGPIAKAVAFEGILSSGESLAGRLLGAFRDSPSPQLVNIAVDGETFGHHHRFGDMALAFALHHIETNGLARITNYGEFLELHPPTHEVEIAENSSWSCAHGIERWRSDCGCNTGGGQGWNQSWRGPLRDALNWLRDATAPAYENEAREFFADPWQARDSYIQLVLDRSLDSVNAFLGDHATKDLTDNERIRLLKLLEMQRHAMLMYTSCGWFFDELSRIETVQVMQYAGRVAQLAQELFGDSLEKGFLDRLSLAKSNLSEHGDGRRIYERFVLPATVDLSTVAAHLAVSSVFESYGDDIKLFCYPIVIQDFHLQEMGRARLAMGKMWLSSEITTEARLFTFGTLYFGEHNLNAGVRDYRNEEAYAAMVADLSHVFESADFTEVVRGLDRHFGSSTYSLKSLFRDEQRKVMSFILEGTLYEIEQVFRQLYEHQYPPMRFLTEMGNPLPKAFKDAAEFILNTDLRRALTADELDATRIESLVSNSRIWCSELDVEGHGYLLQQTLTRMMREVFVAPDDEALLERMSAAVDLSRSLPFPLDLGQVQTLYYRMVPTARSERAESARAGDAAARGWLERFDSLGTHLKVRSESQ
jgi:alpha-amylase/alpha-mannosidase (GH57 family)